MKIISTKITTAELSFAHLDKNVSVASQGKQLCMFTEGKGWFSLETNHFLSRQDLALIRDKRLNILIDEEWSTPFPTEEGTYWLCCDETDNNLEEVNVVKSIDGKLYAMCPDLGAVDVETYHNGLTFVKWFVKRFVKR